MSTPWPFSFLGDNITLFNRYFVGSSFSSSIENILECPVPDPFLIQFGFLAAGLAALVYQATSVMGACVSSRRFGFFEEQYRPSYVTQCLKSAGLYDALTQSEPQFGLSVK